MTVTALSALPRDKLLAVLNHDRTDIGDELGGGYRQACAAWFAGLTGADCRAGRRGA